MPKYAQALSDRVSASVDALPYILVVTESTVTSSYLSRLSASSAIFVFPRPTATCRFILLVRKEASKLECISCCLIDKLESFRAKQLPSKEPLDKPREHILMTDPPNCESW